MAGEARIDVKRPKRKPIPKWVKSYVVTAQRGRCLECGELLGSAMFREYDHRPPLFVRQVNAEGTDYIPPQNDPHFIEALHKDCHLKRTVGRVPGALKTVTTKGSDAHLRKKFNRLENPRKKRKIPSRQFPKRRKENVKA